LLNCLSELKIWLDQNFLSLNDNKVEFAVFGRAVHFDVCVDALGISGSHV